MKEHRRAGASLTVKLPNQRGWSRAGGGLTWSEEERGEVRLEEETGGPSAVTAESDEDLAMTESPLLHPPVVMLVVERQGWHYVG